MFSLFEKTELCALLLSIIHLKGCVDLQDGRKISWVKLIKTGIMNSMLALPVIF